MDARPSDLGCTADLGEGGTVSGTPAFTGAEHVHARATLPRTDAPRVHRRQLNEAQPAAVAVSGLVGDTHSWNLNFRSMAWKRASLRKGSMSDSVFRVTKPGSRTFTAVSSHSSALAVLPHCA